MTTVYNLGVSVCRVLPGYSLFLPVLATMCRMDATYGPALQAARRRAGIKTQQALGDAVDLSERQIRNYETNKIRPPLDVQERLEALLGHFWDPGDEVEAAVKRSDLAPHRQTRVIQVYQEAVYEQAREAAG